MSASPYVPILREKYKEWHDSRGESVDSWLEICSPTMTLWSSAQGGKGMEFTAPCSCLDDVRKYLSQLRAEWSMDFYTVEHLIGEGDVAMAFCHIGWTHRQTGKSFEIPKADRWIFANGKAVSYVEYYDPAPAFAALQPER